MLSVSLLSNTCSIYLLIKSQAAFKLHSHVFCVILSSPHIVLSILLRTVVSMDAVLHRLGHLGRNVDVMDTLFNCLVNASLYDMLGLNNISESWFVGARVYCSMDTP